MELSSSNIKKFLTFSKKKALTNIANISGNENPEKNKETLKNFLYFRK